VSEHDPVTLQFDPDEGAISIDEIAKRASLEADLTPLPRERLRAGAGLARGLLALTALVIVLIAVFAILTYPSFEEVHRLALDCKPGTPGCDLLAAQQQRITAWFDDVKDLVQLLVVSLLIPLLATLIGYLFGGQISQHRGS
jgi:hypothetical protein